MSRYEKAIRRICELHGEASPWALKLKGDQCTRIAIAIGRPRLEVAEAMHLCVTCRHGAYVETFVVEAGKLAEVGSVSLDTALALLLRECQSASHVDRVSDALFIRIRDTDVTLTDLELEARCSTAPLLGGLGPSTGALDDAFRELTYRSTSFAVRQARERGLAVLWNTAKK